MRKTMTALFFIGICFFSFLYSKQVLAVSAAVLTTFFEVLVPSMFFLMVILKIMEETGILARIGYSMRHVCRMFHINVQESTYALSGLLLGFAANASLLREANRKGLLQDQHVRHIAYCLHLPTITFCVLTCGILLGSVQYGFLLYAVQFLLCAVFFLLHPALPSTCMVEFPAQPLLRSIKTSLAATALSLFYMAGYILLATVLFSFVYVYLPQPMQDALHCFVEFSSSSIRIIQLSIPLNHKLLILSAIFGFGGFCGHMQIFSFLENIRISYPVFLGYRITQAVLSILCMGFILYFF